MTDDRVFVDEFRKNSLEVVRVQLTRFGGNASRYLDVRVFMVDERSGGTGEARFEGVATKKGLTLSVELIDRLIDALNRARVVLDEGEG